MVFLKKNKTILVCELSDNANPGRGATDKVLKPT